MSTYNKLQFEGVFRVLEKIAILDSQLVCDMLPHVTQCVRDIEAKRGAGQDHSLRQKYRKVLTLVGPRGDIESEKLSNR